MPSLIRDLIIAKIQKALEHARTKGLLPFETTGTVEVEHPSNSDYGDFATSLPLRLARSTRIEPLEIADILVKAITYDEEIDRVYVAPPGFINFVLKQEWLQQQVVTIIESGESYGTLSITDPQRIMIEFVSVNPTGPVHVGHARGAVLGSTLATILEAAGHTVTKEYYINDAGTQMGLFNASVYARYLESLGKQFRMPDGGYQGGYVTDLALEILDENGSRYSSMKENEGLEALGDVAREKMVENIKADLNSLGVNFDRWFREHSLFESGEYDETLQVLQESNYLVHRDGALWFKSTSLGDDKDNVIIRSNGAPTYFASDIAYHHNKFIKRSFDKVINIWGSDHQGHVTRLKAAVTALGVNPERLNIIISQMVTLKRGHEVVKVSKRTGELVTLRELVDEVGADACRYFFLSRAPNSQMDFDLYLATKESSDNPVYYIQYAHARIASILKKAEDQCIDWTEGDVSLLQDPTELGLIRKMLQLPEFVEKVSKVQEPHHMAHYALELATSFHWFYENCRVISSEPDHHNLTLARLKLLQSSKIVLSRTLQLMGMDSPEIM